MSKVSYKLDKGDKGFKIKLPVRLVNIDTGQSLNIIGRIDTGAEYCTFSAMMSRTIGLVLNEESKCEYGTKGVSGESLITHKHWIRIEILSPDKKHVLRSIQVLVNTLEDRAIPPLLGVNYFLDKFKFIVDFPNGCFDLEWE